MNRESDKKGERRVCRPNGDKSQFEMVVQIEMRPKSQKTLQPYYLQVHLHHTMCSVTVNFHFTYNFLDKVFSLRNC